LEDYIHDGGCSTSYHISYVKNIITIQHTQSVHYPNRIIDSWTDWQLTEFGKEQTDNIVRKLSAEMK